MGTYRNPYPKGFVLKRWNNSQQHTALLKKIKTFARGDPIVIYGAEARVDSIDEETLTVYVYIGARRQGYSVTVVEHDPKGTKAKAMAETQAQS